MKSRIQRTLATEAPAATILIRLMVGGIFLSEGIQKFLFPAELAAGRFEKIGIPFPEIMGPFVGAVEIICGMLLLVGFLTRLATIPLIIAMCVAMFSIKLPILLGHGFWGFSLRELPRYGFWSMMRESRNDLCMIIGSVYLLIVGAGRWSMDHRIFRQTGR
jgi:uncharacterized membrane protein YphA (DoxX/SURF4 family)